MDIVAVLLLSFAGGLVGGLLGVGGGVLFVPALAIFLDHSQVGAEATSLLAIVPVGIAGAWRQSRYGNVRLREAMLIGGLSPVGVAAGVVIANAVSERVLELSFAALALLIAIRLIVRALRAEPEPAEAQRGA
jgi:uncharacterized membrane protein YfcA